MAFVGSSVTADNGRPSVWQRRALRQQVDVDLPAATVVDRPYSSEFVGDPGLELLVVPQSYGSPSP